jgi:hypothetical protein
MPDTAAAARALADRVAAHWRFKVVAGGALTAGFLTLYLLVQHCHLVPQTAMPVTALDRWIGFHPGLVWLYESFGLYLPIAPWLMTQRSDLVSYCWVVSGMSLLAFAVFLVWPTSVLRPVAPPGYLAFRLLTAVDGPVNACPSLHAAMSVFSATCAHTIFRRLGDPGVFRFLNGAWCAAILYATLATKQHMAADVVAGAALGVAASLCWRRSRRGVEAR